MASVAANITQTPSLCDRTSCQLYLVDTGADISVFPATEKDNFRCSSSPPPRAANGSVIKTYGTVIKSLNFLGGSSFTQKFVVAKVSKPILGVDFLFANDLLIDPAGQRLLHLGGDALKLIPTTIVKTKKSIFGLQELKEPLS